MENRNCLFKWCKKKHFSNQINALWFFCAIFFCSFLSLNFFVITLTSCYRIQTTHIKEKKFKLPIKAHLMFFFLVLLACVFSLSIQSTYSVCWHLYIGRLTWHAKELKKQRENGADKLKVDETNKKERTKNELEIHYFYINLIPKKIRTIWNTKICTKEKRKYKKNTTTIYFHHHDDPIWFRKVFSFQTTTLFSFSTFFFGRKRFEKKIKWNTTTIIFDSKHV